jgi:CRISPR associated protein Cas2 family
MALFFVNYDLVKRKDYQTLWDRLEQWGAQRVLLSTWAIKRDNVTAAQIRDDLCKYIDNDDRLLVDQSTTWAGFNLMIDLNQL